uniref:Ovule protein n=1 Tax=Steinernema glaseri TaxID=37863 RepID=A0A1I7Z5U2_9BILA
MTVTLLRFHRMYVETKDVFHTVSRSAIHFTPVDFLICSNVHLFSVTFISKQHKCTTPADLIFIDLSGHPYVPRKFHQSDEPQTVVSYAP